MPDLEILILNILREAAGPMSAATIAEQINRQNRTEVDRSDVNTCLCSSLSPLIVKCPRSRWTLKGKPLVIDPTLTYVEENAVLAALERAREPLGVRLLSIRSGIAERRLKEIVPVLVQEGVLKKSVIRNSARYSHR